MIRRSGSSLLIVVLILTVVSVLTVTGARILLLNSRQSASYDSSSRARQVGRAGVEEALARFNNASTALNAWGEFGNETVTEFYPLTPVRREFSGTDCGTVVVDLTLSNCPYYDISIRNVIAIKGSQFAADATKYNKQAFQTADFPSGTSVTIPVIEGDNFVFSSNSSVTGVAYFMCQNYDGSGVCTPPASQPAEAAPNFTVQLSGKRSIKFTINYTLQLGVNTVNLLQLTSCTPSPSGGVLVGYCAIGKGYTTAEVIGHAGEIGSAHYLIEKHGIATPVIKETAEYLDNQGFRYP